MSYSPEIGKRIYSRYEIVKLLGSGGFGDTYLAHDSGLPGKPQCVVKHLKPKDPNPAVLPIAKGLFQREAETLYKLGNDCNQVPRLFAHCEENNEFYLVQEYIDGHDLSYELTPGKTKSEQVVVKLLQDILEVLTFVHKHNVIHRDIKPQNIMRRLSDGKIVLIDFGAVKEINVLSMTSTGQTSLTVAIGSPGYMSSEQAKGKPRFSSDVYAVGMIGIQALTGLLPTQLHEDPTTGEMSWRHLVLVSDPVANVLEKMLRENFSQRYQNAAEALQALLSIIPNQQQNYQVPDTFVSPSQKRQVTPGTTQEKKMIPLYLILLLFPLCFLSFWLIQQILSRQISPTSTQSPAATSSPLIEQPTAITITDNTLITIVSPIEFSRNSQNKIAGTLPENTILRGLGSQLITSAPLAYPYWVRLQVCKVPTAEGLAVDRRKIPIQGEEILVGKGLFFQPGSVSRSSLEKNVSLVCNLKI